MQQNAFQEAMTANAILKAAVTNHELVEEEVKPSYQMKALFYRAYCIQKRQMFTNIFCIGLCPFFIVFISTLLGTIANQIYNIIPIKDEILSCSKLQAVDEFGWPLSIERDLPFTSSNLRVIRHFNMYKLEENFKLLRFANDGFEYCEFWFNDAVQSVSNSWDSTYLAQPVRPWLKILNESSNPNRDYVVKEFARNQQRLAVIYGGKSNVMKYLWANSTGFSTFSLNELEQAISNSSYTATSSILEQIQPRYWVDFATLPELQFHKVPIFSHIGGRTVEDLDSFFTEKIQDSLVSFSQMNKSVIYQHVPSDGDLITFYGSAFNAVRDLPHGAIWFDHVNHTVRNYKYTLQIGREKRLPFFPRPGKRKMVHQSQLSNAFLRLSNSTYFGNYSIVQGIRAFPHYIHAHTFNYPIAEFTARLLFPLGLSCLIPIFVVTLVKEKESKTVIMMRMNGVKLSMYLLIHYCVFLILYWLSAASFLICGHLSGMEFFENTSLSVLLTVLSIWGHLLICLSLFISVFFSRSSRAFVFVSLMILCSVLIHVVLIRYSPATLPESIYYSWPPLTFYKALDIINVASYSHLKKPYTYADLSAGNELYNYLLIMYAQNTILFALAGYLSYVTPSEFGVRRPWYYALYRVFRQCCGIKKRRNIDESESLEESQLVEYSKDSDDDLVRRERYKVLCTKEYENAPLVIKNITKIYHRSSVSLSHCAIDKVTFAIEKDKVFGLLGCNGAGKSSLLGILTGLFESTSGTALVAGYDVSKETKHVYRNIGVCPQFNILWELLTVKEHLLFYARIKGFNSKEELQAITDVMEKVDLLAYENVQVNDLSCGQKRKLAIGIALIGEPKVIFLDEPTNDLDPIMRRQVWNIINEIKKDRAIILSTHSMNEAQICCQKVGIMKKGGFSTIGTPLEICQLYATGYNLTIRFCESKKEITQGFISSLLPIITHQTKINQNLVKYQFQASTKEIARVFEDLKLNSSKYFILNWELCTNTLSDAFQMIHLNDTGTDFDISMDMSEIRYS